MSFLRDYVLATGVTEVPMEFHRWCGIAALAACAQDHVWVEKGSERVVPNLYTFLLGPSGIGKDAAINTACRLLADVPSVRMMRWRGTAPALIDTLTASRESASNGKAFLVTPELAQAVRRGELADDFIKLMTDLYSGSPMPLTERTRTSSVHVIREPCVNWLAGTTREWLRDCVSQDAVEGGFFGRVCAITASYDLGRRVASPSLPAEHRAMRNALLDHLLAVAAQAGPMWFEPAAQSLLDDWYMTRPAPEDELAIPVWRRQHTLVIKLSMLLTLSDDASRVSIGPMHVVAAQRLAAQATSMHTTIAEYVAITKESEGLRRIRDFVRDVGTVPHEALARFAVNVGVTRDKLKIILESLLESALIQRVTGKKLAYQWAGRRTWEPEPDGGEEGS